MSTNFNALLNPAVVATHHAVLPPGSAAATGADVAAVQGNAAAVRGAAAHGAANVAGTIVSATTGADTSAQRGPKDCGVPVPNTEPSSDVCQHTSPPGRPIRSSLRRPDSTIDWVPPMDNAQYYNVRLSDAVNKPSARDPYAEEWFNPQDIPLLFPDNLFPPAAFTPLAAPATPASVAFANPGPPRSDADRMLTWARFRAAMERGRKGAHRALAWSEPGLRRRFTHEHHLRPDEYQDLWRLCAHGGAGALDKRLLQAEAISVANKVRQLDFLSELRKLDLAKPESDRENFVTGAEAAAQLVRARLRYWRVLSGGLVALFAESYLNPEAAPLPAPAPASCPGVSAPLKRRREAGDEPAGRPAKRARVGLEPKPRLRFAFLRRLDVQARPRRRTVAWTHPEPLTPHARGAAASTSTNLTSDVAIQANESVSTAVAGPSHPPPPPAAANPFWQPSTAPLPLTPQLTDAGRSASSAVAPRTGKQRHVHFAPDAVEKRRRGTRAGRTVQRHRAETATDCAETNFKVDGA